jgi:DNA-binding response OmpR family regulator
VPPGDVATGTQELSRPDTLACRWDEPVPPDRDATLLAVVPIPRTRTSLAIVGYVISTSGAEDRTPPADQPAARSQTGSGLVIDHVQRRVWADGGEITLTFQEFELLAFLSAHPATVFSRADLLGRAWQRGPAQGSRGIARDSRTIDVHVSRLRRKLGPAYGQCLVTEYRAGYQFRPLAS